MVHAGTDANGTTVESVTYGYDVRGRMTSVTDVAGSSTTTSTYAYDDDGTRVKQVVAISGGATTTTLYVVDNQNPSGYSQVLEEKSSSGTPAAATLPTRTFALGLDVIGQNDSSGTRFLLYDGHGSTRALASSTTGLVVSGQVYTYDAYGNLINFTGTPQTSLLYSGEQTDTTGLQYLRSRFYDPKVGRFASFDSYAGDPQAPQSLHRYLYVQASPIRGIDPSGKDFTLASSFAGSTIGANFNTLTAEGGQSVLSTLDERRFVWETQVLNTAAIVLPGAFLFFAGVAQRGVSRVILGELDTLRRATGIRATITAEMIKTGTEAASSLRPAGFISGFVGHQRGHLLANQLGGSGNDIRNLVTLYRRPNHPGMSSVEFQVRRAVEAGETVDYWAIPIYSGDNLIPDAISIRARGDRGFSLDALILNEA